MSPAIYHLLPFRFRNLGNRYLLVSENGQFQYLDRDDLCRLIHNELSPNEPLFNDLKSKDIICLKYTPPLLKTLAAKYRTKKKHIFDSTALHMMVLTYRCNQRCAYCHASSEDELAGALDMSVRTAQSCLDFAFESPSPYLKIEFQGGEPTLNFNTLKVSVEYGKALAERLDKKVEFVVCTNLYDLNDSKLAFLHENDVQVSTSLDGPQTLHDSCRKSALDGGVIPPKNSCSEK